MVSLFKKQKSLESGLLSLRSSCVLAPGPNDLEHKRDMQLQWMREKGLRYLADPGNPVLKRPPKSADKRASSRTETPAQRAVSAAPLRLLEVVKDRSNAA